jgi:hypothetical protein
VFALSSDSVLSVSIESPSLIASIVASMMTLPEVADAIA